MTETGQPEAKCETCGKRIYHTTPVIRAIELRKRLSDDSDYYVAGRGVLVHVGHLPSGPEWKVVYEGEFGDIPEWRQFGKPSPIADLMRHGGVPRLIERSQKRDRRGMSRRSHGSGGVRVLKSTGTVSASG